MNLIRYRTCGSSASCRSLTTYLALWHIYVIFMHLPNTCGLGLTVTTGLFADAPMVGCLLGGVPVGLYSPALITLTRPVAWDVHVLQPTPLTQSTRARYLSSLNVDKWVRARYVPKLLFGNNSKNQFVSNLRRTVILPRIGPALWYC